MRVHGWEQKLEQYLDNVGPFEWGVNDCCLFAVKAVDLISGRKLRANFPEYAGEDEAAALLKKLGGVYEITKSCLGACKPVVKAQRGDVVLFDYGAGHSLGICVGDKIAAVGANGVIFLKLSKGLTAWSV